MVDKYIGHLGQQHQDDTLAENAEAAPALTIAFAAIERRAMKHVLGWRYYIWHLLPAKTLMRLLYGGK